MNGKGLLTNKNAVITGCRRGIGNQIVKLFAENGANIWACARKKDAAFETEMGEIAQRNHVWIKPVYFEMTNAEEIKAGVKQIRADHVPIDILVNNAGTTYDALLPMISVDKARELFEINFFSHLQLTQLISRLMIKQSYGCIINTSSYLAEEGNRGQTIYSASKAAMSAFTRSLAKELAQYGIRVNAVAPGTVNTELIRTMSENELHEALQRTMLHRLADPREIADVYVMLASDMSSYINGQIIRVDGCM